MTLPVSAPGVTSSTPGATYTRVGRGLPAALEVKTGQRFRLRVYWPNPPELRCPKCGDWHPITPEFWHLNQWSECRTCHSGRVALREWFRRREDPAYRRTERLRSKRYRDAIKESAPHLVGVYDRERRAHQARRLRDWRAKERAA